MITHLSLVLPELILTVSGLMFLLLSAFLGRESQRFVLLGSMVACGGAILAIAFGHHGQAFSGMIVVDAFSDMAKSLLLCAGLMLFVLSSSRSSKDRMAQSEYSVLVLFGIIGGMILVSARDFMTFYVGLELQAIVLTILAAYEREKGTAVEAGIKYFILGSLASVLVLYGISFLYGVSGATGYQPFVQESVRLLSGASVPSPSMQLVKVGMAFLFCGIAFKMSVVPFHLWTVDVYDNTPLTTTTFFATIAKISVLAAMTRLSVVFYQSWELGAWPWDRLLFGLALVSIAVGACGGLVQARLKSLIAYSSILNMGFALLPLVLAGEKEGQGKIMIDPASIEATWVFIIFYILSLLGFFAVVQSAQRKGVVIDEIKDLSGIGQTHPLLALCMSCFLLSLAGVPPLVGFVGKFSLVYNLMANGFSGIVLFALLASVIAAGYYLRLVKVIYFDPPREGGSLDTVHDWGLRVSVVGLGLLTITLTLWPSLLLNAVHQAAESLRIV